MKVSHERHESIIMQQDNSKDSTSSSTIKIGMIDSGVGGLSIHREICRTLTVLPLQVHYVSDSAFFPYGTKDEQIVIDRILKISQELIEKFSIQFLIIACNTASTVALQELRKEIIIPVIGVVPAIKPAAQISKNKIIGLLATEGTIRRPYTDELIQSFAAQCQVIRVGSSRLVHISEQKTLYRENVIVEEIKKELIPFLEQKIQPDVIVLACTHFPLLSDEIRQVIPPYIQIIDSGAAIANRLHCLIGDNSLRVEGEILTGAPTLHFHCSSEIVLNKIRNSQLNQFTDISSYEYLQIP